MIDLVNRPTQPLQPILTPPELGISKLEYDALIWTRDLLASGSVVQDQDGQGNKPYGFNMMFASYEGECGTTCCIGGWMYHYMNHRSCAPTKYAHTYVVADRSPALIPLFFPFTDKSGRDLRDENGLSYDFPYELIAPSQGLAAINNFLATGNPDWPSVVGY